MVWIFHQHPYTTHSMSSAELIPPHSGLQTWLGAYWSASAELGHHHSAAACQWPSISGWVPGKRSLSAWLDLKVISSDHSHSVSPQSGSQTLHRCVNENDKRRREHRENTWGQRSFRIDFDKEIINWPSPPPSNLAFAHALCIGERHWEGRVKLKAVKMSM